LKIPGYGSAWHCPVITLVFTIKLSSEYTNTDKINCKAGVPHKGSRGMGFIEFVEFLGFFGLMKQKCAEGATPTACSNTINPKNTMNKATLFGGLEGPRVIQGLEGS
jgi:hypothetical protein